MMCFFKLGEWGVRFFCGSSNWKVNQFKLFLSMCEIFFGCKHTSLLQIMHWGQSKSAWILHNIFQGKGISIPDTMVRVIGLGYETFQDLTNKENDSTLVGFQELLEDYVLIHEGIIIAILLKILVPSKKNAQTHNNNGTHVGVWGSVIRMCF